MQRVMSFEVYEDLKRFFSEDFKPLRGILVQKHWSNSDYEKIKACFKGFSNDFFDALSLARSIFLPNKVISVFQIWFDELNKKYGKSFCEVFSSLELSNDQKKEIESKLIQCYDNLCFKYIVSPSLIGGFCVKVNGLYFDGSLKRLIVKIEKEMQNERF